MAYFTTNAEAIGKMSKWLRLSLITLIVTIAIMKFFGVDGMQGNPLGILIGMTGFVSLVAYMALVFFLTRSLDPKPSVAWTVFFVQIIPILGFIIAISMISKGLKIANASAVSKPE